MRHTCKAVKVKWGPRATPLSCYETFVPAGHPVRPYESPTAPLGIVWFAEPEGLGLEGIERHDAEHYGIPVPHDCIAWTDAAERVSMARLGYVHCAHASCFAIFLGRDGDLCEDCQRESGDPWTGDCAGCDNDTEQAEANDA